MIAQATDKFPVAGISKSLLGECLAQMGRMDEAGSFLVEGYNTLRDANGPQESALNRLIEFYEMTEQPERAAEYRDLLNTLE